MEKQFLKDFSIILMEPDLMSSETWFVSKRYTYSAVIPDRAKRSRH